MHSINDLLNPPTNFVNLDSFEIEDENNGFSIKNLEVLAMKCPIELRKTFEWTSELKSVVQEIESNYFDMKGRPEVDNSILKTEIFKKILHMSYPSVMYTLIDLSIWKTTADNMHSRIEDCIEEANAYMKILCYGYELAESKQMEKA